MSFDLRQRPRTERSAHLGAIVQLEIGQDARSRTHRPRDLRAGIRVVLAGALEALATAASGVGICLLHLARAVHVKVPCIARDRTAWADPLYALRPEAARAEAELEAPSELDLDCHSALNVEVRSARKRKRSEIFALFVWAIAREAGRKFDENANAVRVVAFVVSRLAETHVRGSLLQEVSRDRVPS